MIKSKKTLKRWTAEEIYELLVHVKTQYEGDIDVIDAFASRPCSIFGGDGTPHFPNAWIMAAELDRTEGAVRACWRKVVDWGMFQCEEETPTSSVYKEAFEKFDIFEKEYKAKLKKEEEEKRMADIKSCKCFSCANSTNKSDTQLYCKSLKKWYKLPYEPDKNCPFDQLERAMEVFEDKTNFISIHDSSMLVGIPTIAVTWVNNSTGGHHKVHINAGYLMYDEDCELHTFYENKKVMMEKAKRDAHQVICAILGQDWYKWHNSMEQNPSYSIIGMEPVLVYDSVPDGSSA
jgi:hypothetical protein